jgi:hypothetical protein
VGSCLRDYTTALDLSANPPRYTFYLELLGDIILPAAIATLDEGAQLLDTTLNNSNYGLQKQRNDGMVGKPQIELLAPGSFNLLCEKLIAWNPERNRNQLKIPRYLSDEQQIALMESQVIAASDRDDSHNGSCLSTQPKPEKIPLFH